MTDELISWAEEILKKKLTITKEEYGDQSKVFRLHAPNTNYFAKIGKGLEKERARLDWLAGKLPIPKVIGFATYDGEEILLLSAIEGKNLAALSKEWSKEKVVDKLVKALLKFHSVDATNCPFGTFKEGKVLVHGDACLPNFIFQEEEFSGYIDLGDLMVAKPDVDFAAAIWSLQYNLGPGYGKQFLQKYGAQDVADEMVEKLRLQYEDMQKEWGL
jgi:aminoglycoside phosphotransferase